MRTPLNHDELQLMKDVCRLAAQTLKYVGEHVDEGITTDELDKIAYNYILSQKAQPAPLNYKGFPKSICTSVNECICHGVPRKDQKLKKGDIINLDVTCVKDGFYGDTSKTFFVDEASTSKEAKALTQCAYEAMMKGIEAISPYGTTGDIGFTVSKFVKKKGFYPVLEIGGHGIGRQFHEDPFIPSFGKKGKGDQLIPGTCITVEPMVNLTDAEIAEISIAGSSIKEYETSDKTLSAQFEHTIYIGDEGYEILTVCD